MVKKENLIIIGSGIAGLSAAVYSARGGHEPLIIHGDEPGGQLTLTTEVANYPGFPESVGGTELIDKMNKQASQFGAKFEHGIVKELNKDNNLFHIELDNGDEYKSECVIVASGASARTLGIPGEDELMGYGLSTCATCDGAFFRGEEMAVVGGGDAAFEEAIFLTKFASKVHLIHRREGFRSNEHLKNQLFEKVEEGDVEIHKNTEAIEVNGSKDGGIDSVKLATNDEGYPSEKLNDKQTEIWDLDVGAVFIAIGHTPNTSFLESTDVKLDEDGYIIVESGLGSNQTATGVEGLFAAGDVVDHHYQQAATASGMGVKASLDADEYLEQK